MNRIEMIKKAALTVEGKKLGLSFEQYEGKLICDELDARKAAYKVAVKLLKKVERRVKKDLTGQVKKAGHLASGNLDFNRKENMYYSDKDTQEFIRNSSYFDAYQNTRDKDWD